MGRGRVEVFKTIFPNKHEGFVDLFLESLDSWFSADIACCDACYDEFVRKWPGTYLRDMDFQRSAIDLGCFYEGSDLADVFTEDEFWENLKQLKCPRCGVALSANIWPYNFPFDVPNGFEENVAAIAELAKATPFLVLVNTFAKAVYDDIQEAAKVLSDEVLRPHCRGRLDSRLENPGPAELGPPPPAMTGEGRYNHAGRPVCYMASDPETVFLELGEPSGKIYLADVEIKRPVKIIDFAGGLLGSDTLNALIYSSLLSSPTKGEGWDKPEYMFSRFVADCVQSAGIDGIRYPSTRSSNGHNVVLFNRGGDWNGLVEIGHIKEYEGTRKQRPT